MTLSLLRSLRGRSIRAGFLILGLLLCVTHVETSFAANDSLMVLVAEAEADWFAIESEAIANGVDVEEKAKEDPDWLRPEARGRAILDAQKKGMEQALSLLIPYDKIEANHEALNQEILLHAEQYSATSEVVFVHLRSPDLSDRKDKGSTSVRVRLFVDMETLRSKVQDMGLYQEKVPAADALLLLQVQVADVPFDTTGCHIQFRDIIQSNGINVLEPEDLGDSLPGTTPYDFSKIDWLTELGKEFAADFVFVVECTGTMSKMDDLYVKEYYSCAMDGKCLVVDVVNNSILDSEAASVSEMAEQAEDAARKACMTTCGLISEQIIPRARMRWSDRYWAGVNVTVEVEDSNYPFLEKFLRTLHNLRWINMAMLDSVVENHAVIQVNVRDSASGLAATIGHLPNIPAEVTKVSPDRIVLKRSVLVEEEQPPVMEQ